MNAETKRRLKLFGIGVLIGSVVVYFMILRDRNVFKGPQEVIFEKMNHGAFVISEKGKCDMDCYKITEADVKNLMGKGDVKYKESKVHEKPCPFYAVDGKTADGREIRAMYKLCTNDSLTELVAVRLLASSDSCDCK